MTKVSEVGYGAYKPAGGKTKGPIPLRSLLGKQNIQAKEVYWCAVAFVGIHPWENGKWVIVYSERTLYFNNSALSTLKNKSVLKSLRFRCYRKRIVDSRPHYRFDTFSTVHTKTFQTDGIARGNVS